MNISPIRWSEDLVVSCYIDGKLAIFRFNKEKFVQEQLKYDFKSEILRKFSWGKVIDNFLEERKYQDAMKNPVGYYDVDGNLLYNGFLKKGDSVLASDNL